MPEKYYLNKLYPFQDEILREIQSLDVDFLNKNQLVLKIDFINDVPFHFGNLGKCDFFGNVDNWRNILSNKICALSRMEPKDYADILFIAGKYPFSWEDIIEEAKKKDLWVEPIEVSRIIKEFPVELLTPIKWVTQPDLKQAQVSLALISEDILKGDQNSLVPVQIPHRSSPF